MEKEPKHSEIFIGNFPIEPISELRKKGERYVNEEVQRIEELGKYEGVRTDVAYDENREIIIGERAIFATPKK